MTDVQDPAATGSEEAAQRPLEDDLRALVQNGLALAKAEFALQKAKVAFAGSRTKSIALLGIGAFLLIFFAFTALTVGAVLSLATLIGPLGATLVVFAVLALLAGLSALTAARNWRRMTAVLSGENRK